MCDSVIISTKHKVSWSSRLSTSLLSLVFLSAGLLTACPDAPPEHIGCENNSDCADGKICNVNINTCVKSDAGELGDANTLVDGSIGVDRSTDAGTTDGSGPATDDAATTDGSGPATDDAATTDGSSTATDDAATTDGSSTATDDAATTDAATPDAASADHADDSYYALAGDDQYVDFEAQVHLDASASVLPAGATSIEYSWTLTQKPAGSTASISGASAAQALFVPNDAHGVYTIRLSITVDGNPIPDDSLQVFVNNRAPVARAGADAFVKVTDTVQLDGTASSDPDGDDLTYHWTLQDSTLGSFDNVDSATPTFTPAPGSSMSSSIVTLVVTDPDGDSDSDTLTLSVQDNLPPSIELATARFGIAHRCSASSCSATGSANGSDPGTSLSATVTDPENDTFDLLWSLKTCADGSAAVSDACASGAITVGFDDATVAQTDFGISGALGAFAAGDYVFELRAEDSNGNVSSAELTVIVQNTAPSVNDGTVSAAHSYDSANAQYVCHVPFTIDASDADGDPLTVLSFGSSIGEVRNVNGLSAEFWQSSAQPGSILGPYTVTAQVSDEQGGTSNVTMTLSCTNTAPVISRTVESRSVGHQYNGTQYVSNNYALPATLNDANGDPVTCEWSAPFPQAGVSYYGLPVTMTKSVPDADFGINEYMYSNALSDLIQRHHVRLSCTDPFNGGQALYNGYVSVTNQAPHSYAGLGFSKNHYYDGSAMLDYKVDFDLANDRGDSAEASDPDGDPITITWTYTSSSVDVSGGFDNAHALEPTLSLASTDLSALVNSQYDLTIEVSDGLASSSDTTQVTARNRAPIVDAGGAIQRFHTYNRRSGLYSTIFDLSSADSGLGGRRPIASASDPDGDPLTYLWRDPGTRDINFVFSPDAQTLNPTVTVSSSTTVSVAPHILTLDASDGLDSASDTLTATAGNHAPVANNDAVFDPFPVSDANICSCANSSATYCTIVWTVPAPSTTYTHSFTDVDGDPIDVTLSATVTNYRHVSLDTTTAHGNGAVSISSVISYVRGAFNDPYYYTRHAAGPAGFLYYDTATVTAQVTDGMDAGAPSVDNVAFNATNPASSCP